MSPPPYLHPSAGQPSLADLRSIVPLPFPPTPRHVSFPVQTLAKTAKTVPVMLWGATMLRKRYTPSEYALAALVTSGCTLFLVSGESAATVEVSTGASSGGGSAAWGGALMAVYLGFDGFTSTFQERLYRGRLYRGGQEMTPHHQVLFVTAFSCALNRTQASHAALNRLPNADANADAAAFSCALNRSTVWHVGK